MDGENDEFAEHDKQVAASIAAHQHHLSQIGWFVLCWSKMESDLFTVLLHYANVSEEVGRAMLPGPRASVIVTTLNKLCENTQVAPSRLADLRYLGAQLTTINTIRDTLVHHGEQSFAMLGRVGFSYATKAVVKGKTTTRIDRISTTNLQAASFDLATITEALARHLHPDPFTPLHASPDPSAWHCKPLGQDNLPEGGWYMAPPKLTPRSF